MRRGASLTTIVRRALDGECAPREGAAVVVAVSGGPDSMALLDVMARLGPKAKLAVFAHGVDHGLRPEASAELALAEQLAARLGVPWSASLVAVARGGNLQARARDARWRALTSRARELGAAIATAHHADDRAETVLMRLLRGAGLRGLAVMPPTATAPAAPDVGVIRPLLRARREDVMLHLARHRVPHALDPSNVDPRYLRTRVRQRLLPLLAELDPAIIEHLTRLADEAIAAAPGGVPRGAPPASAPLPASLGWASSLPRATQEALAALSRTRSPGARVWLPGGLVVSAPPAGPAIRRGSGAKPRTSKKRLVP